MNLAISLTQRYSATTGLYGGSVWDQAWAMIGLRATGDAVPINAISALSNTQATGGGWGFAQNDAAADPIAPASRCRRWPRPARTVSTRRCKPGWRICVAPS